MAGPAYQYDARAARGKNSVAWPERYDDTPLFYEWTRDYIKGFHVDGARVGIEAVVPGIVTDNPIDMEFGPDGALYVLEYGDGYFAENPDAQLSRIDFVGKGGNRSPVPKIEAEPTASPGSAATPRSSSRGRAPAAAAWVRGAAAGAAGATVLGMGAPALASGPEHGNCHGHGHGRQKEVPTDLISIQLDTLRSAMTTGDSIKQQLDQLAGFGYERVERAGLYPAATGLGTAAKLKAEFDARGLWASSSHDGISVDAAALNKKLDDANTFRQKYIVVPYLNSNSKSDRQHGLPLSRGPGVLRPPPA